MGIREADHEETSPTASTLLITRLACSLVGQTGAIKITKGSIAHQAYRGNEAIEAFRCNFGLNPVFRNAIGEGPLVVTGVDDAGDVRIIEVHDHPFFVGTLFVPQLASRPSEPHPLVVAYLRATLRARARREVA